MTRWGQARQNNSTWQLARLGAARVAERVDRVAARRLERLGRERRASATVGRERRASATVEFEWWRRGLLTQSRGLSHSTPAAPPRDHDGEFECGGAEDSPHSRHLSLSLDDDDDDDDTT